MKPATCREVAEIVLSSKPLYSPAQTPILAKALVNIIR